jgi:hypothetical protein
MRAVFALRRPRPATLATSPVERVVVRIGMIDVISPSAPPD